MADYSVQDYLVTAMMGRGDRSSPSPIPVWRPETRPESSLAPIPTMVSTSGNMTLEARTTRCCS